MKIPKCPSCGSRDVKLTTTLEDFEFWINNKGEIEFEILDVQNAISESPQYVGSYLCECENCGKMWDYEEQ